MHELDERKPVVAGQFYPDNPQLLRTQVDGFLTDRQPCQPALGLMAPHAGYLYSGAIAGATFSSVEIPDSVILIGPNHQGLGEPCGVYSSGSWQSPLGSVVIDDALAEAIINSDPLFVADTIAHRYEHSLEVMLPFLSVLNPQVKIVPICLRPHPYHLLEQLAHALSRVIAGYKRPVLIVASSDMTHYESVDQAAKKDHYALEAVLNLDGKELYQRVTGSHISMCGMSAVVVTLLATKLLGAQHAELIRYGHSGEVTDDNESVVGYAGIVVR